MVLADFLVLVNNILLYLLWYPSNNSKRMFSIQQLCYCIQCIVSQNLI